MSTPGFTRMAEPPTPYGANNAGSVGAAAALGGSLRDPVDPAVFVNAYTRPLPSPEKTFAGPGYQSTLMPTSGWAVAALICGILGVFTLIPALPAIVLGHVGLWQTSKRTHAGRGLATGGLVLGYAVATVVALVMFGSWVSGL